MVYLLPYLNISELALSSTPLAFVFNQLLSVDEVLEVWKKAVIIPVHRKGPPSPRLITDQSL